jgi:hypothetical protein
VEAEPRGVTHRHHYRSADSLGCTEDGAAERALADLRAMYEPYVNSLSVRLMLPLPEWLPKPGARDNWQKSKWV